MQSRQSNAKISSFQSKLLGRVTTEPVCLLLLLVWLKERRSTPLRCSSWCIGTGKKKNIKRIPVIGSPLQCVLHTVSAPHCDWAQPCLAFCRSLVHLLVSFWSHTMGKRGWSRHRDQWEWTAGGGEKLHLRSDYTHCNWQKRGPDVNLFMTYIHIIVSSVSLTYCESAEYFTECGPIFT